MSKSMLFSTDLSIRKLQYQDILVKEGSFSYEEVVSMSMVELRSAVDELCPVVIVQSSVTMRGGKTRKATILKAS